MNQFIIEERQIFKFIQFLQEQGASSGTMEKYRRDVRRLSQWLDGKSVSQENITRWKEVLLEQGLNHTTVNSMLAAANAFFRFAGWEFRAKFLRVKRKIFRDPARELTRQEYLRLVETALKQGFHRLALLMETICATGIRVSEAAFITVEAAKEGKAEIYLKGKVRTILLPHKLCRKLLQYAKKQKTASGGIFLTRSGKTLSRKQIWAEMKALCQKAGVTPGKVFPHNLRHLFARTFYQASRDVVKLADVLGHSSIETTRIYAMESGAEHQRMINALHLTL